MAIVGIMFVPVAYAQVHGCTLAGAEDHTGEAEVVLVWSNPHDRCVLVNPGTMITWDGNLVAHPLAGGDVTVGKDDDNPISSPGDNQSSVVLNDEGDYPYFCLIHTVNMTGVVFVRASPPADFNKSGPANGASDQSTSLSLTWASSDGATSYEYCIDQSLNSTCNDVWNPVGTDTNADPAGLSNDTSYQWQVRAVNDAGTTEANGGSWWQFTTVVAPPGAFNKTSPADAATGQSNSPTLVWLASAGAVSYEYCIDMSDNDSCNSTWTGTGLNTSVVPPELSADTEYYWQARAVNPGGTTEANGGSWWQFRTQIAPPAAFNKSSPANGANNQPTDLTLTWQASGGAVEYEYCIDTVNNNDCDASWTSVDVSTNASPPGLSTDTQYYWQVRATNDGGTTQANGGTWWNFRTVAEPPAAFGKSSPANGATDQSTVSTLSWSASSGASSYEYCIDTTNNDSCDDSWISVGANTSAVPDELSVLTTYYWQARASNAGGTTEADGDAWWNFETAEIAEGVFDDGFESTAP